MKILMKKASDSFYEEIVEMSEHELIELLKSDEYITSFPVEMYIKKYGPHDLMLRLYDDYVE